MKILILDLLNMGDLVMVTPSIRVLRAGYPNATIDMLATAHYLDTVRCNPNLDNAMPFEKGGRHQKPMDFLKLALSLRRNRYDLLLSFHESARTGLLSMLIGARQRWGLVSKGYERLYSRPLHLRSGMHRVDSYLSMMEDLGFPRPQNPRMELHTDQQSEDRVRDMWREAGLENGAPVIGLAPGALVPWKEWPPEHFADLAVFLKGRGFSPVLFGGKKELGLAELIRSRAGENTVVDFVGKLSVMELAVAARRCAAFAVGDTGPLHVAASQGTPIAALFGPSDPVTFHPYGTRYVMLKSSEPCAGCQEQRTDAHTCLSVIQVQAVADAVLSLVED